MIYDRGLLSIQNSLYIIPHIIERDSYMIKLFYGVYKETLTVAESK